MLVNILNESGDVVDSFKVCFFDEVKVEAKKRIQSGLTRAGHFFHAGDTFWRVVEADGTLAIEIDKKLTEKAKRMTQDRAREREQAIDDSVSKGTGFIRLKVSIVAAVWMIFWCYIGLELEYKYRSDFALLACVAIGLLGLFMIFLFLVILLKPDEPISYHGHSGLIRGLVFLVNRFVIEPKRRASNTDDHDLSMDFDEYQSLNAVSDSFLVDRDKVSERERDQTGMDSPVRKSFSAISKRTKILLGTLFLCLLILGVLNMFAASTSNDEFKPKTLADMRKFQIERPSATAIFFSNPLLIIPAAFFFLPIYLFISGKWKYDQEDTTFDNTSYDHGDD
ncbi:hypothetical protein OAF09_01680 [bacterium]|nr:hypothetical protein [bacterium]